MTRLPACQARPVHHNAPDVIATAEQLNEWLPALKAAPWVAIDTEADSLHSYPEKLCLVQLSIPGEDRLVDPLASTDLRPLYQSLAGRELILHAADYDLRLLNRHASFVPDLIFDTMLAARLLGHTQFGLGSLVEELLGVKLEKGPQKADWSRRPLTPRMEEYARNDTRHLKAVSDLLRQRLTETGRLAWHQESCRRLIEDSTRPFTPDPDQVWRIKGSNKLTRHGMAVLRSLWHWREKEAAAGNRPPFFILQHDRMIAIADRAAHQEDWQELIPPRYSPRRRQSLEEAAAQGMACPQDDWPERIRGDGRRPTEPEKRAFAIIQTRRDKHAGALGIDPTLIASKSTMFALGRDWDEASPQLMNWQRDLLKE